MVQKLSSETDMTGADIAALPGCVWAVKKAIPVRVVFARATGKTLTLEGEMSHASGDAILTGVEGEQWPVRREVFLRTYEPVAPTRTGEDGVYCKKPLAVCALRLSVPFFLRLERGTLRGKAEDWLLQYDADNYGVVDADIFSRTYAVCSTRAGLPE